jgi:hypothetical protein
MVASAEIPTPTAEGGAATFSRMPLGLVGQSCDPQSKVIQHNDTQLGDTWTNVSPMTLSLMIFSRMTYSRMPLGLVRQSNDPQCKVIQHNDTQLSDTWSNETIQ